VKTTSWPESGCESCRSGEDETNQPPTELLSRLIGSQDEGE
jgi:hypothetical protein